MQIIIIGCGKVGSSLAAALIEQDQDVVIIDSDPALIQAADTLDCIKIPEGAVVYGVNVQVTTADGETRAGRYGGRRER